MILTVNIHTAVSFKNVSNNILISFPWLYYVGRLYHPLREQTNQFLITADLNYFVNVANDFPFSNFDGFESQTVVFFKITKKTRFVNYLNFPFISSL